MSPLPNAAGGRPRRQGRARNQRAEDRAAAQRGTAGHRALAQEGKPGVTGYLLRGLADRAVGIDGVEVDMCHRTIPFSIGQIWP